MDSQAPVIPVQETIEECTSAQLDDENETSEGEEEIITVSKEVVCVNSSPAVLVSSQETQNTVEQIADEIVTEEQIIVEEKIEVEAVNGHCSSEKSYEIIESADVNGDEEEISRESLEFEIDTKEPLTNVTEIEDVPTELETGASGSATALPKHIALERRTRTESENRDWDNWADSPTMKVKNTTSENSSSKGSKSNGKAKENGKDTPSRNSEKKGKNGSTGGNAKKGKNLKKVMETSTENVNRDSTTPDSAKESDVTKTKKKRRNGKKKKTTSTSTTKSSVKASSSDSGTATDDNIERYMEISGFPAVSSYANLKSLIIL